ncbi:MotA/TolQ/ExbB proton channel family protein [Sulfurimonas sp.]|uniref:MotA/TolQ/ExbB proton channel family protein n=1 Tax=Sulfurimonas sp. TaxID=2022749 RepID=UPI0025E3CE2A|nr:MotA/TolQ/ExbB proton channel family protein [Sulfurimonas sp.]MDD5156536.1 MotA/TolQ/ExbB proton channel family protein [Sulfurimonas sp.]
MYNTIIDFYIKSNSVTIGVMILLALYFIVLNWIFFYRYLSLSNWIEIENSSLENLLLGSSTVGSQSFLNNFIKNNSQIGREILDLGISAATSQATKGLSILSIFSSTTPFIGLFGTVVSILGTFSHIGDASGGMSVVAAGVSDALVATASGIFVAIFAYTYHQILSRKSFDIINVLQMQSDVILARKI